MPLSPQDKAIFHADFTLFRTYLSYFGILLDVKCYNMLFLQYGIKTTIKNWQAVAARFK